MFKLFSCLIFVQAITQKTKFMKTIGKIKNAGIKVLALRNIDYTNQKEWRKDKIVNETQLDASFVFYLAKEPYELDETEKHTFWNHVLRGKESKAEQMILEKYKK